MGRRLGQHFLKDSQTLKEIAGALDSKTGETVIEIGPGHGELTKELRVENKEQRVVAIEKDAKLVSLLRKNFSSDRWVEVIEGDALEVLPSLIQDPRFNIQKYKLVGNIPYYITGYLLRVIEGLDNKPELCVFTIQKEVAERIIALPPKMNRLSAAVRFWSEPELIKVIPKKYFSPPPEVDSAVIKLRLRDGALGIESHKYFKVLNFLFKQPRKTILNNLTDGFGISKIVVEEKLKKMGVDGQLRPQNLELNEIVSIVEVF